MMHTYAYMPIIAAAAADIVVAMIWFSDYAFGPMFKKLIGAKKAKYVPQKLAVSFLLSILKAAALFIAISVFQKTQTGIYTVQGLGKIFAFLLQDSNLNNTLMSSMKIAGFLWLGFLAPQEIACHIWGDIDKKASAINLGQMLVSIMAMAAVIATLS